MAQNISWLGNDYTDVPFIELPKTAGGQARFDDTTVTTAEASDVAEGKVFVSQNGTITIGTGSGGDSLVIMSYGNSTWSDFISAYRTNTVVYCRASSNSNPATGSQTRMAFMAYVNNETNPTEVEFQYYRSVSSHSDSQQGDQVFVYKLTSNGTWTVTTRNAFTKIAAGTAMTSAYNNGTLTMNVNTTEIVNLVLAQLDNAETEPM